MLLLADNKSWMLPITFIFEFIPSFWARAWPVCVWNGQRRCLSSELCRTSYRCWAWFCFVLSCLVFLSFTHVWLFWQRWPRRKRSRLCSKESNASTRPIWNTPRPKRKSFCPTKKVSHRTHASLNNNRKWKKRIYVPCVCVCVLNIRIFRDGLPSTTYRSCRLIITAITVNLYLMNIFLLYKKKGRECSVVFF